MITTCLFCTAFDQLQVHFGMCYLKRLPDHPYSHITGPQATVLQTGNNNKQCVTLLWDLAQRGPRLTNPGCRSNARARALLNERWKDGDGARTSESQLYRRVESAPKKETRTRLSCKDLTVQSLRDIAKTWSGPCTARIDEPPLCYGALGSQQAQQVNAVDFAFKRTLRPSGPSRFPPSIAK